jgi:hypothetical protein
MDTELTAKVGEAITVTVVVTAEEEQLPFAPVTVYTVVEVGLTEIELVVAPVFHVYVVAPVAVKVAAPPEQIEAALTETVGVGLTVALYTALTVPQELEAVNV